MPRGVQHERTPAAAVMRRCGVRVVDLVAAMHAELGAGEWAPGRFRSDRGAQHRVTRILTGRLDPTPAEAGAIARALDADADDLFTRTAPLEELTRPPTPAARLARERGLTTSELATRLHVELCDDDWRRRFTTRRGMEQRVSRILRGATVPSLGEACALGEVLGVPSHELWPEVATGPHPLTHVNGQRWSWSSRAPQRGR